LVVTIMAIKMVGDHHIVTNNPRKKIAGDIVTMNESINEYSIERKRIMVEGRETVSIKVNSVIIERAKLNNTKA